MHAIEPDRLTATDAELARMMGISARHLWNMDRDGRIGPTPLKLGKSRRWNLSDVRAWLDAGAPSRAEWQARKRNGGDR